MFKTNLTDTHTSLSTTNLAIHSFLNFFFLFDIALKGYNDLSSRFELRLSE